MCFDELQSSGTLQAFVLSHVRSSKPVSNLAEHALVFLLQVGPQCSIIDHRCTLRQIRGRVDRHGPREFFVFLLIVGRQVMGDALMAVDTSHALVNGALVCRPVTRELDHIAGTRYFCNQCHVSQADTPALVENIFRSSSDD